MVSEISGFKNDVKTSSIIFFATKMDKSVRRIQEDYIQSCLDAIEDHLDAEYRKYPWRPGVFDRLKHTVLSSVSEQLQELSVPYSGANDNLVSLFRSGSIDAFTFGLCNVRLGKLVDQYNSNLMTKEVRSVMDVQVLQ